MTNPNRAFFSEQHLPPPFSPFPPLSFFPLCSASTTFHACSRCFSSTYCRSYCCFMGLVFSFPVYAFVRLLTPLESWTTRWSSATQLRCRPSPRSHIFARVCCMSWTLASSAASPLRISFRFSRTSGRFSQRRYDSLCHLNHRLVTKNPPPPPPPKKKTTHTYTHIHTNNQDRQLPSRHLPSAHFLLCFAFSVPVSLPPPPLLFLPLLPFLLFSPQPLVIVVNKVDTMKIEDAPEQFRERLKTYEQEGVTVLGMSTLSKEGVAHVKNTACDKLLSFRIETKSKNPTMMASINKLNVATPRPRDSKVWFLFFDFFFSIKD